MTLRDKDGNRERNIDRGSNELKNSSRNTQEEEEKKRGKVMCKEC